MGNYYIQGWSAPALMARKITITIRHSDWPSGESGAPLSILTVQKAWGDWVVSFSELQELELEFETMEKKKEALEEQVGVALKWTFPFKDGTSLVRDGKEPLEST